MKQKRKIEYRGLNEHRRVSWSDDCNRLCIDLGNEGMSIAAIAFHSKLTQCQVMYRLRARKIHVTDYRNGKSPRAMLIIQKYLNKYANHHRRTA